MVEQRLTVFSIGTTGEVIYVICSLLEDEDGGCRSMTPGFDAVDNATAKRGMMNQNKISVSHLFPLPFKKIENLRTVCCRQHLNVLLITADRSKSNPLQNILVTNYLTFIVFASTLNFF